MDAVHSLLLLIALVAGGSGAAILVWVTALPRSTRRLNSRLAQAALASCIAALLFGSSSLLVHRFFGHGHDSLAPMSTGAFFEHHRAYWLVLVFIVLAFGAWRLASRRQRQGVPENG